MTDYFVPEVESVARITWTDNPEGRDRVLFAEVKVYTYQVPALDLAAFLRQQLKKLYKETTAEFFVERMHYPRQGRNEL